MTTFGTEGWPDDVPRSLLDREGQSCYSLRTDMLREDWLEMGAAPRDGSVVEIACLAGIAPWYGLYRWTEPGDTYPDGEPYGSEPGWRDPLRLSGGVGAPNRIDSTAWFSGPRELYEAICRDDPTGEKYLLWRPTAQDPAHYVDPTRGEQGGRAYWLRAIARRERSLVFGAVKRMVVRS